MEEEIIIKYLNKNIKVIKLYSESNKRFQLKIKLIKLLENKNIEWKEANKISKIWYNIKFNKCKYQLDTYKYYLDLEKELNLK